MKDGNGSASAGSPASTRVGYAAHSGRSPATCLERQAGANQVTIRPAEVSREGRLMSKLAHCAPMIL